MKVLNQLKSMFHKYTVNIYYNISTVPIPVKCNIDTIFYVMFEWLQYFIQYCTGFCKVYSFPSNFNYQISVGGAKNKNSFKFCVIKK